MYANEKTLKQANEKTLKQIRRSFLSAPFLKVATLANGAQIKVKLNEITDKSGVLQLTITTAEAVGSRIEIEGHQYAVIYSNAVAAGALYEHAIRKETQLNAISKNAFNDDYFEAERLAAALRNDLKND